MKTLIGFVAVFGFVTLVNKVLLLLGYEPESNKYFGDDYDEE